MGNEQNITRSEVESMISAAISFVLSGGTGAKGTGYASGLKHPPAFSGPTGYGESQAEVAGIAMAHKVAREQANKRIEDARPAPNTTPASAAPPPAAATPAQKHVEMGSGQRTIPDPIGGNRASGASNDSARIGTNDVRGLSRETGGRSKEAIADQIKVTQEKFKERAKNLEPTPTPAPSFGNEVNIQSIVMGLSQQFITRGEVESLLSGIPPQIRTMGSAANNQQQHTGQFLKLEGPNPLTAVWGTIDGKWVKVELCIAGEVVQLYVWANGDPFEEPA
ncbi:MAG: hypothetical protein NT011_07890 [Kiritimatiellaeota bacterium]|nr:hypothetical protein [Kiritimatiellota bacterium]